MTPPPPGDPVVGPQARFRWERALRADDLPWHIKSFLLLVGTYMSGDGTGARPSSARLVADSGLSRQTVFRLLQQAEASGWMVNDTRPGKPTERVPAMPDPSHPCDGFSLEREETRHTHGDGYPSHPCDGYGMGLSHNPSHPCDDTRHMGVTQQEQDRNNWGHAAPRPLRHDPPQAPGRNDQPPPDQADGPAANSSPKPDPPRPPTNGRVVAVAGTRP